jgi:hypothetical protein
MFAKTIRRIIVERFLKRHQDRIEGIISGFDRVLFRGSLRSISHIKGMEIFLRSHHILYKDFGAFAQNLTNQIKAQAERIAKKHNRPLKYLPSSKVRKEDAARNIMKQDHITQGLICIFSCLEPCQSFVIGKDRKAKKLYLKSAERKCLHLYFYFIDPEFGFMHIRLQTWLPFTIQVCINGRSWLAKQMDHAGIGYERHDNCFTHIDSMARAQQMFDRLTERKWVRWLQPFAKRVNPWIRPKSGLNLRSYYWSVRESEYATDVLFRDSKSLAAVYPALVRHAIDHFQTQDVLRFLGRRTNKNFEGEVETSLARRMEGVRVRHWVEENSIKMYDKKGSVLRVETTVNNPRRFKVRRRTSRKGRRKMGWLRMRKGVVDIRRRIEVSRAANERYLEALAVVGTPTPSHQVLDSVSKRQIQNGRHFRPLHPISPDDGALFKAILQGKFLLQGFTNKDVRKALLSDGQIHPPHLRPTSSRITRWLRLFRAHGLIQKVSHTRLYRITQKGYQVMVTATKFRETDIALLAA